MVISSNSYINMNIYYIHTDIVMLNISYTKYYNRFVKQYIFTIIDFIYNINEIMKNIIY